MDLSEKTELVTNSTDISWLISIHGVLNRGEC